MYINKNKRILIIILIKQVYFTIPDQTEFLTIGIDMLDLAFAPASSLRDKVIKGSLMTKGQGGKPGLCKA